MSGTAEFEGARSAGVLGGRMLVRDQNLDVRPGKTAAAAAVAAVSIAPAAVKGRSIWQRLRPLRSFAVFLALWHAIATWNDNAIQLPTPWRVAQAFAGLAAEGEIAEHALVSSGRLALSLLLAMLLAIPLGFLMGLSRRAEALVDPLVELLRPISGIAWIPLALFIFGVGGTLPVFIMVYVAFFPLLLNTIAGVRGTDRRLIAAARTMGVGRVSMLRHVVVPAALPMIMVGVRLAFAGAWAAVIAAELIGSPRGLGFAVEWYRQLLMTPKVFSFIVLIGIVGFLCDLGLRALQRWMTPWSEGTGLQ